MKELVLYGIFGVLTTALNIAAYWFVARICAVSVVPSTVIAWLIAVLFAYVTNRLYVFHSTTRTFRGIMREALYFFGARIATGIMDVIIMYVFVDVLSFHDVTIKTVSNVLVIIFNYIFSKLIIFRK